MAELQQYINRCDGVLLVLLAVMANFLANTLSCGTQNTLTHNMYAKSFLVFLIVYFATNFTSKDDEKPRDLLVASVGVWVLFMMFTKLMPWATLAVGIALMGIYVLGKIRKYNKHEKIHQDTDRTLSEMQRFLMVAGGAIMLVGFILYFQKQKNDHKDNFDMVTFIFGVEDCTNK